MPRLRVEEEIAQARPHKSTRDTLDAYDALIRRAHELRAGADRGHWGRHGRASLRSVARALLEEGLTGGREITAAALRRMLMRHPAPAAAIPGKRTSGRAGV